MQDLQQQIEAADPSLYYKIGQLTATLSFVSDPVRSYA
jgi:hypothetical protein